MWGFVGTVAKFWGGLPGSVKGFTLGTVAGLALSAAISLAWPRHDPSETIARQNAEAALDSTRKYASHHDTVYARLLAQKDVELTGALGDVARLRKDNAKLSAKLTIASAESRTQESHTRAVGGSDSSGASHNEDPQREAGVSVDGPSVSDSLVLPGPPVVGTVGVTVTAQADAALRFDWDARLRPSPVKLEVGLGCGEDGPELLANGPPFATVEIQPGEVDPDVCNPTVRVGLVQRGLEVVGGVAVIAGVVKLIAELIH